MAKKTVVALVGLNALANLIVKVGKDGNRRTLDYTTGGVGEELAACKTPADIGAVAVKHGLTEEEVKERAETASNFGQYRMVIGNRLAAIERRMATHPEWTKAEAAYPKTASKARREAAAKERDIARAARKAEIDKAKALAAKQRQAEAAKKQAAKKVAPPSTMKLARAKPIVRPKTVAAPQLQIA